MLTKSRDLVFALLESRDHQQRKYHDLCALSHLCCAETFDLLRHWQGAIFFGSRVCLSTASPGTPQARAPWIFK
jgi:hypothetical protein